MRESKTTIERRKIVGIYKITSPSGKVYIGQSWNILDRWMDYKCLSCKNQRKLYNSFISYGIDCHKFEIAHELPLDVEQKDLDNFEYCYWDLYKSCGMELLNLREPGSSRGKHSEETKKRMSVSKMAENLSFETRRKLSESQKNKTVSENTRKKISEAKKGKKMPLWVKLKLSQSSTIKGKPLSQEHREKISKSNKGRKLSEEESYRLKNLRVGIGTSIICNETGEIFKTIQDASNFFKICRKAVYNSLKGKIKTPKSGYSFSYIKK